MIRFSIGPDDGSVKGRYTLEEGIEITAAGALGEEEVATVEEALQSDITALIETSPHAVAGAYAMALRVLILAGATVDTSKVPKFDPDRVY